MKDTKKLKNVQGFKDIYVKDDETKLARSENYRLKQKARELRIEYPNEKIKIEKGVLKRKDAVVDKFDLRNQRTSEIIQMHPLQCLLPA